MSNWVNRELKILEFERTLSATPEAAFDAWTDPKQVAEWWDPGGERLVSCTIDLRPAGAFRFESKGHAPPFTGTYQEVKRPERLRFEALGAVGVVTFTPDGSVTRMLVQIRCSSEEHLQTFLELGVEKGTAQTLDNLVRHVARSASGVASSNQSFAPWG